MKQRTKYQPTSGNWIWEDYSMLIFALTNTVHVKSYHTERKSYSQLPCGTFCTRLQAPKKEAVSFDGWLGFICHNVHNSQLKNNTMTLNILNENDNNNTKPKPHIYWFSFFYSPGALELTASDCNYCRLWAMWLKKKNTPLNAGQQKWWCVHFNECSVYWWTGFAHTRKRPQIQLKYHVTNYS